MEPHNLLIRQTISNFQSLNKLAPGKATLQAPLTIAKPHSQSNLANLALLRLTFHARAVYVLGALVAQQYGLLKST